MADRKLRIPSYRHQKSRNLAVVRIDGQDVYLGEYGSPESREKYDRIVAEWLARGRTSLPSKVTTEETPAKAVGPTITEIVVAYVKFADGYYIKEGKPTGEADNIRHAIRPLRRLYGSTPAAEFGPKALKSVREDMVRSDLCRSEVNRRVDKIRRLFRWAVAEELIPANVHHALRAVEGIRKGRADVRESEPVRPVADSDVEAVLPQVSRQVRAMLELQRLTGMRPGEVVAMRTRDVDRSEQTWIYRPGRHKTEHHEKGRAVYIGPKGQAILEPWLRSDPDAYLFSPAEAHAERMAAKRAGRRSPVQPSQVDRRKARPERTPGECYDVASYRRAVAYGCKKAGVPKFHPHRLRHSAATALRREFGIEVARIILGHSSAAITMVYAEADAQKAAEAMAKVG